MIARGSDPHAASHIIGCTDNAMIKIALTKAPTSLLECAVYISARNKLIDAMSLDIDRPINRAVVVGCAISAGLTPLEAIPVDQFTGRPLLHFTRLPRCPLHYLLYADIARRLVLASRLPSR